MTKKRNYSRKSKTEAKKNLRTGITLITLSIAIIAALIFYGIPLLIEYTGVVTNLSSSNNSINSEDETAPPPPRIDNTADTTNQETIDINGSAEPGATIVITANDKNDTTLVNKSGRFSYTLTLTEGVNSLSLRAKDLAGNESDSVSFSILHDKESPEFEILEPASGTTLYGESNRQITIKGTTENTARVRINGRIAVVDTNGQFSYTTRLEEGENSYEIKIEDQSGNTSEDKLTVTFSP